MSPFAKEMPSICPIFKVFQMCGLLPIVHQPGTTSIGSTLVNVANGLMIVVNCALVWFAYINQDTVLYSHDTTGNLNNILKYVVLVTATFIILVEAQLRKSNHQRLWQCVGEVQASFRNLGLDFVAMATTLNRRLFRKFFIISSIIAVVEYCINTSARHSSSQWLHIWLISLLPSIVCWMVFLFHTFYMDMLGYFLSTARLELKRLVRLSESDHPEHRMIFERLFALKSMFGVLWRINQNINEAFAWSQAFNFLQVFVEFTCDLHWLYKSFDILVSGVILCFLPPLICMGVTLTAAVTCVRKARELPLLLHQIRKRPDDRIMNKLIHHFSLQLRHERIYFSANSLFDIDYGLFRSMAAGVTTYMVIFVQFTPASDVTPIEQQN